MASEGKWRLARMLDPGTAVYVFPETFWMLGTDDPEKGAVKVLRDETGKSVAEGEIDLLFYTNCLTPERGHIGLQLKDVELLDEREEWVELVPLQAWPKVVQ